MAERQRPCSVPILPAVSAALAPPEPPPEAAARSRARLERAMAASEAPANTHARTPVRNVRSHTADPRRDMPSGTADPRRDVHSRTADPRFDTVDPRRPRTADPDRTIRARLARIPRPRLVAVAGLAVAVAVAAVVVVPRVTGAPGVPPETMVPTGRETLLAAADTAAAQPVRTGKYWHVRMVTPSGRLMKDTWTNWDGRQWVRGPSGRVRRLHARQTLVWAANLSVAEIQRLPGDPVRLKAALLRAQFKLPPISPADYRRHYLLEELMSLLTDAPAPPKVRAAAFRLLARLPMVTDHGAVGGDPHVRWMRIDLGGTYGWVVLDPRRAELRNVAWTGFQDPKNPMKPNTRTGSWTNHLPGRRG